MEQEMERDRVPVQHVVNGLASDDAAVSEDAYAREHEDGDDDTG